MFAPFSIQNTQQNFPLQLPHDERIAEAERVVARVRPDDLRIAVVCEEAFETFAIAL